MLGHDEHLDDAVAPNGVQVGYFSEESQLRERGGEGQLGSRVRVRGVERVSWGAVSDTCVEKASWCGGQQAKEEGLLEAEGGTACMACSLPPYPHRSKAIGYPQ